MKLIVGLGNPGKEYTATRHNAGFWVLDRLADQCDADWSLDKTSDAKITKCRLGRATVILAKPQTYMNDSGRSVASLLGYYKIKPHDLLVVQDEMDLPAGALAFAVGGRAAGHNGLSDIQDRLKGVEIQRLRLGIGKPTRASERKDWVLSDPSAEDKKILRPTIDLAADATLDWIQNGVEAAMNTWNRYKTPKPAVDTE